MNFDVVQGQSVPVSILKKALENMRVPTAYLFTGPPGCGRTMAALATASSLNCLSGEVACGSCTSCHLYAAGNHPDLHILGPAEGKRQIVIQQIREGILERAYLKPMSGKTSTFIIQEADLLNINASNAFLKTLEEPPETSHFILIAPDRDSVLPTISSRCQILSFSPLPRQVVENILVEEGIPGQEAAILATMAKGSVKRARNYHTTGALGTLSEEFESLSSLHSYPIAQLLDLAQQWGRNRQDALSVLEFMIQWYRDMMILAEGAPEDQVVHVPHLAELKNGAVRIGGRNLAMILEAVEDAREAVEANTNVQLTLDTLLLRVRAYTLPTEKSA
jgi:DNA polymerase-3 subunit delta'